MARWLLSTAAALILVAPAGAGTAYSRYFIDELKISNTLEKQGVSWGQHRIPVDTASCTGLRRYGVKASEYGLDRFWRFRCDVAGANDHYYDVQVSVTKGPKPGWWYWHQLSIRREF